MPGLLTLQHHLPFAVMSDKCIAKIEQCREKGEDYTIKIWKPKDPQTVMFLGSDQYIATVITGDDDAQGN